MRSWNKISIMTSEAGSKDKWRENSALLWIPNWSL